MSKPDKPGIKRRRLLSGAGAALAATTVSASAPARAVSHTPRWDTFTDVLVAGSAVFRGGSVSNPSVYGENIRAIRPAAEGVWA